MPYTPRTTSPVGSYRPEYMRFSDGGWNSAIYGHSASGYGQPGASVLHNCVGYAQGRMIEIHNELHPESRITSFDSNIYSVFNMNAEEWYGKAIEYGFSVGQVPKPGAVGVYVSYEQDVGHVAIFEYELPSGDWIVSEGHWQHGGTFGSWDNDTFYAVWDYQPSHFDWSWHTLGFIYYVDDPGPVPPGAGRGYDRRRRYRNE